MKILLDQNLSYKLVNKLDFLYLDMKHVSSFNLQTSDDKTIWEFARANHFALVTKDADFYDFSLLKGFPPKIIWLKCGNSIKKYRKM